MAALLLRGSLSAGLFTVRECPQVGGYSRRILIKRFVQGFIYHLDYQIHLPPGLPRWEQTMLYHLLLGVVFSNQVLAFVTGMANSPTCDTSSGATSVAGPEMLSKRLATTLALALVLVAAASAKGVHEPERLNADVDKHAADDFINPINVVAPVVGLAKGIIAAIIISVIIVVVLIIVCCVCMCRACAGKKETHTVVYTGHPNQQMPQQYPPQMHQQWPPGAPPTSPPHEYRGPTEPSSQPQAYSAPPPAYPPGPAYVPPNKY